jgi:signal transduction histidine kinase
MRSPRAATSDTFNCVLKTAELAKRFSREPDYATENRALVSLMRALNSDPRQILQALADTALEICEAGSAGISLLDSETGGDPNRFRWRALAGRWPQYIGAYMPRAFSPCGVVLSQNSLQLMQEPGLHYDYVNQLDPPCREVLLVPFHLHSQPIGTIWVVMHDEGEHFDAEAARVMTSLATFASGAYQTLKSQETLEHYNRERAAQVQSLQVESRSKDEWIATIAHELRNPLGTVRTSAAILQREACTAELVKRTGAIIDRQVGSMSRLIEDLLDVSRVRLGTLELTLAEVNLAEVVRRALEHSPLGGASPTHHVELQIQQDPLVVKGDALRLSQVLENLFNNAAKYTDPHGRVSIRLFKELREAVICIVDTGIGIAPEQIGSIFDLFAQAGQAGRPRSRGGLGIGLHLAKQLVNSHSGSLTAFSPGVGLGSTFIVRLPLI